MKKVYIAIAIAALLWFLMFNPWMGLQRHFWPMMAGSSALLTVLVLRWGKPSLHFTLRHVALGVAIAAALWGVFWLGDKISAMLFHFSRAQVNSIYAMGDGTHRWLIGAQLLLLTGPAEELFWRGFVQQKMSLQTGPFKAMLLTLAIYTLIHIWSFNFMLIMAAWVAGLLWGTLFWLKPDWLPALILSHALWDTAVFVVFPI